MVDVKMDGKQVEFSRPPGKKQGSTGIFWKKPVNAVSI